MLGKRISECMLSSAIAIMFGALASGLNAQTTPQIRIHSTSVINDLAPRAAIPFTHGLALSVANIGSWPAPEIIAAVREAARIVAQCGIQTTHAELLDVIVPESHRDFDTPRSRELARVLDLPKPTLYFAAGTRAQPAFDAEAIGRGNSRTRPELADTVWIARGARDLGLVVAHELAHVLMDSGAHDRTPGNLMAEHTTPGNTYLSPAQCARMRVTGARHGLLRAGVD